MMVALSTVIKRVKMQVKCEELVLINKPIKPLQIQYITVILWSEVGKLAKYGSKKWGQSVCFVFLVH